MNENECNLNILLEEIRNTRNELKNYIEACETKVLMKIEGLNEKIRNLEKENQQFKSKIEYFERELKQNSILIYGLNLESNTGVDNICQILNNLLKISITPADINNYYTLNLPKKPIKINFISNLKKRLVFSNCRRLKGTQVSICNDLTYNQRQDHKILRAYLKKAREDTNSRSYIKGHKLYIGESVFTAESLSNLPEDAIRKAHSEPPTPSYNAHSPRQDSTNEYAISIGQNATNVDQANSASTANKETPKSRSNIQKIATAKPKGTPLLSTTARERLRSFNKK